MSPSDGTEPADRGRPTEPARPPLPAGAPLLRVAGLRKSFGDHEVLRSIDLEVRAGEVVALIGPSGSGKTTVLRSLNGLETPDAGRITVGDDVTVDFSSTVSRRDIGTLRDCSAMVFQHYNLFPHLTVLENVIEGPVRVRKRPRAEAEAEAGRLLARVGLAEK